MLLRISLVRVRLGAGCLNSTDFQRVPMSHSPGEPEPSGEGASSSAGDSARPLALPKIIRFQDLSRCGGEVWIENEGQLYRLRRTRQGKLILTK